MAKSFTAQLKGLTDLAKQDLRYIAQQSIQDVLEGAQTTQRGITQGATSFEVGKIPVGLTSDLVNSLTVEGNKGADAYVVALAGMKLGEAMEFAWVAPHAVPIEMGWTTSKGTEVPGRFFVGTNAAKFSDFVEARAAEVRK